MRSWRRNPSGSCRRTPRREVSGTELDRYGEERSAIEWVKKEKRERTRETGREVGAVRRVVGR